MIATMFVMASIRARAALRSITIAFAIALLTLTSVAQERDRAKTPDKYKWDLTDVYPTEAAWRAAKSKLQGEIPQIAQFKGKLSSGAAVSADALDKLNALDKELSRLYVYASMLADQDTRDAQHQGMRQEMVQLAASFSAEASYIEPEILRFPKGTVETFLASEPRLKIYRFYLEDIARRAAHTLSDAEEKILAEAGPLSGSPSNIFNILSNADFPYPDGYAERRPHGETRSGGVQRPSGAAQPRRSPEGDVGVLQTRSAASVGPSGRRMNGEVAEGAVLCRRPGSIRQRSTLALDGPNIPLSVYTRLIDGVNRNLPTFHRYLKLRQADDGR